MALVVAKRCSTCQNDCKVKTDDTVYESLEVIGCPSNSKGYKKIPKNKQPKKSK